MEFVFCVSDPASFAWGSAGVWLTKGAAWFADDPFVLAHPELFSPVPPLVHSTTGRTVEQVPMSAAEPVRAVTLTVNGVDEDVTGFAVPRRGRGRANG